VRPRPLSGRDIARSQRAHPGQRRVSGSAVGSAPAPLWRLRALQAPRATGSHRQRCLNQLESKVTCSCAEEDAEVVSVPRMGRIDLESGREAMLRGSMISLGSGQVVVAQRRWSRHSNHGTGWQFTTPAVQGSTRLNINSPCSEVLVSFLSSLSPIGPPPSANLVEI
jgi:hypothetical protein